MLLLLVRVHAAAVGADTVARKQRSRSARPCSAQVRQQHRPSAALLPCAFTSVQGGVVKATKDGVVLDPSAVADRRTEAEKKVGGALPLGGTLPSGVGHCWLPCIPARASGQCCWCPAHARLRRHGAHAPHLHSPKPPPPPPHRRSAPGGGALPQARGGAGQEDCGQEPPRAHQGAERGGGGGWPWKKDARNKRNLTRLPFEGVCLVGCLASGPALLQHSIRPAAAPPAPLPCHARAAEAGEPDRA